MSFKVSFGGGDLGDIVISDGNYNKLNSYARITNINKNIITIDAENAFVGDFNTFKAGDEVLIHCSSTNGTDTDLLGAFIFANIELVDRNVLTLDTDIFDVDLDYYYVQAVTVPHFKNLYLCEGAVISPPPYSPFNFIGGILAVKCYDAFNFESGCIDLSECGIPTKYKDRLRPITYQESAARGELDSGSMAGAENLITADRFLLNAGDGACFIAAKNLTCHKDSRIGNIKTYGKPGCRAASDTKFKPSNVINIGGSSIIIAAENINDFNPHMLAKYRNSRLDAGKGLSRCFIASENLLPNDNMLYSNDCISNPYRVVENLGISGFEYDALDLRGLNVTAPIVNAKNIIMDDKTKFVEGVIIIAGSIEGFNPDCLTGFNNFVYCNN